MENIGTWSLIQRLGTETQVFSLANLGGRVALAGTGPTGQIYRYFLGFAIKGWQQNLMFSLYRREASYNAGVIMNNTNACSMKGYEISPVWEDEIINDKGEITGTEHGTDQEIGTQSVK